MATPNFKDIPDLTGTWVLNRKLSTDPDEIMVLQGVPWVIRKVLRHARLSLQISQTTSTYIEEKCDESLADNLKSVTSLRITQTVNPGGFDSEGMYLIDGSKQDLSVPIFGDLRMQLNFIDKSNVLEDSVRKIVEVVSLTKTVIQELAVNSTKGWDAEVIWGFEELDGKKHLTRNIRTTKENKKVIAKMVYDGPD
ncbi:hypothetical protein N7491_002858 [Penicillium cf. griseofulvum]|uniref:Lipocalin-like domain-containing protein n=1 Tax=Penicillium cf. griseofulvum TaxID=2972120 RepID=A0A9W9T2M6_9EURO|nr:hypothetical protein N7472_002973 [Penicillium cf. griseofulvum]KAJ5440452.1 hypothetical protein N7491_002858 [Penicillium cf. griseofulvum]KAJ5448499.1 hypothetical protein N7445_003320 [Penicillium cf. griseofulvum]